MPQPKTGGRRKRPTIGANGEELWFCPACEQHFPADQFYKSRKNTNGLASECKRCHVRINIASRDPNRARDTCRAYMRRARASDPEKFRARERAAVAKRPVDHRTYARRAVQNAIKTGRLVRPAVCPQCGDASRVVHAHHEDYSKPLDVKWLCPECHGREHRKGSVI